MIKKFARTVGWTTLLVCWFGLADSMACSYLVQPMFHDEGYFWYLFASSIWFLIAGIAMNIVGYAAIIMLMERSVDNAGRQKSAVN